MQFISVLIDNPDEVAVMHVVRHWPSSCRQTGSGPAADGNLNNQIDSGDYDVWRAHFGQTLGSGSGASASAAVPEPATAVMLMVGMLTICSLRRGQCRKVNRP